MWFFKEILFLLSDSWKIRETNPKSQFWDSGNARINLKNYFLNYFMLLHFRGNFHCLILRYLDFSYQGSPNLVLADPYAWSGPRNRDRVRRLAGESYFRRRGEHRFKGHCGRARNWSLLEFTDSYFFENLSIFRTLNCGRYWGDPVVFTGDGDLVLCTSVKIVQLDFVQFRRAFFQPSPTATFTGYGKKISKNAGFWMGFYGKIYLWVSSKIQKISIQCITQPGFMWKGLMFTKTFPHVDIFLAFWKYNKLHYFKYLG